MKQRPLNLNPTGLEAVKITYPVNQWKRWQMEPMRFIPHDGKASA